MDSCIQKNSFKKRQLDPRIPVEEEKNKVKI
jgi:hypothetical protein